MTIKNSFTIFGTLAVSVLVLAACKSEEQGRLTNYKPGVYLGKPDTKLSAEQVRQLARRSSVQGNPIYRPSGGGSTGKSGVSLPSTTRGQKQGNP
ncbi:MAG: hypothetical protein V3R37_00625 [Rhodospirillales bacterium]